MIKDDDFLIINEYTQEFRGILYRIQEARMRSRFGNVGSLYGDTFKLYTKLTNKNTDFDISWSWDYLWSKRTNYYIRNKITPIQVTDKSLIVSHVLYIWSHIIHNIYNYSSFLYFKAIIYAKVLADSFEFNFYDLLSDRRLLYDDSDWLSYKEDKETYNNILKSVNLDDIYISDNIQLQEEMLNCQKDYSLMKITSE